MKRQKDFPKEVEVKKGVFYKILWKRPKSMDTKKYNVWGYADFEKKEIWIRLGQPPKQRLSTFFHETIHALEMEWGIDLPHKTVYDLEEPLSHFFSRNTGLVWTIWEDVA